MLRCNEPIFVNGEYVITATAYSEEGGAGDELGSGTWSFKMVGTAPAVGTPVATPPPVAPAPVAVATNPPVAPETPAPVPIDSFQTILINPGLRRDFVSREDGRTWIGDLTGS